MTSTAVLFLAAGYGSRLQRDLLADPSGSHKALLGVAKALLPLGGRPLIEHWLDIVKQAKVPSVPFIICNDANLSQFHAWADGASFPRDQIESDGTTSNDDRRGAVPDLSFAIAKFRLASRGFSSVLVVAGDTLFLRDFQLGRFLEKAREVAPACLVTCYRVSEQNVSKCGIIEVDGDGKILKFVEKPNPKDTQSRLACPCFYHLSIAALPLIDEFLSEAKSQGASLDDIDATGKFIGWLVSRYEIYATEISGRLDIGGLQSLREAEEYVLESGL